MPTPLLSCTHITKNFITQRRVLTGNTRLLFTAVNDVSLAICPGETLGLVGESGSGKSTLGEILGGLQTATSGQVFFHGKDVATLSRSECREYRKTVQFVFQDPKGSMNPHFTMEQVITEPLITLGISRDRRENEKTVRQIIQKVGLEEDTIDKYPSELSGGQCQRVAIARALVTNPQVLICDEPVSALDVSIQAQILNLLKDIQRQLQIAYLFISHDIGVINYMADYIVVMYRGEIVETGSAQNVFQHPREDYTKKLVVSSFAQ